MAKDTPVTKGNTETGPAKIRPARNVCVYCGSGKGRSPIYAQAAQKLGRDLASSGLGLVYGGGGLGLMGEVARAVIAHEGYVTGIIPNFLSEREQMLREGDELIVVEDMHRRKMMMFEQAEGIVALPGGIGTLEELVEQLTWSQLGQHDKPVILANIAGFWDPFLALLDHMREETFIRKGLEVRFHVVSEADQIVLEMLAAWDAGETGHKGEDDVIEKF